MIIYRLCYNLSTRSWSPDSYHEDPGSYPGNNNNGVCGGKCVSETIFSFRNFGIISQFLFDQ
jgi:hypothetical protein